MTTQEIAANWSRFAWNREIPLDERKAGLRLVARDSAIDFQTRAQSACWLAYRATEPLGSLPEASTAQSIAEALQVESSHQSAGMRARWGNSLNMVIAYLLLYQAQDARSVLRQMPDYNWLKLNPPCALNMLRGMALLMASELRYSNQGGAIWAIDQAHGLWQLMALVRPVTGLSHHNGNEIVLCSKALHVAIALSPYAGFPYTQEPLKADQIREIDSTLHFQQALSGLLDPHPQLPSHDDGR